MNLRATTATCSGWNRRVAQGKRDCGAGLGGTTYTRRLFPCSGSLGSSG